MSLTKIQAGSFESGAIDTTDLGANVTATYATFAAVAANLTPRIITVNVANSTYAVLDDTSVNTSGGYLVITGANFQSGAIVTIQDTNATSTTYVNDTSLRAQVPAKSAGSYNLYVTNPDGGTAIKVLGVSYSNTPVWGTAATLSNQAANTAFGVNISANSDSSVTYSNTTALPAGTSLLSNGYFYGTVTIGAETTYTFTVNAIDAENQDTPREFSLTVTVGPPSGTLWAWGLDGYNNYFLPTNSYGVWRSSPTQVGTSNDWQVIDASMHNGAAIKSDGTLWVWGSNEYGGVLGLSESSTTFRSSPTQVGAGTNWSNVSCGRHHVLAVKNNGTLWSWGTGDNYGELGTNELLKRSSPVQVGTGTNWSKVSAGYNSSVAITTDGKIYSWGQAGNGQLGLNSSQVLVSSPTQIGSDTDWSSIESAKSSYSVLALKTNGTLWAWGRNESGELGLNERIYKSSPTQIGTNNNWIHISKTNEGFRYAIKSDGTLWSWGDNISGILGLNDVNKRSSPTQVGASTNWSKVSNGSQHSMLLKTDGTLWLVGRNSYGQLGLNQAGDSTSRSSPTQLGTSTNWIDISPGGYNSFARISV